MGVLRRASPKNRQFQAQGHQEGCHQDFLYKKKSGPLPLMDHFDPWVTSAPPTRCWWLLEASKAIEVTACLHSPLQVTGTPRENKIVRGKHCKLQFLPVLGNFLFFDSSKIIYQEKLVVEQRMIPENIVFPHLYYGMFLLLSFIATIERKKFPKSASFLSLGVPIKPQRTM
jgi:hypothetical protein